MTLPNGAHAFAPQSVTANVRASTRNSGVMLSSAYTKTKSLSTTTSSKKQKQRSRSNSDQNQPPLIFVDVDGIGQYPTDIMDSLLDEECLSFLADGDGDYQQSAANAILSTGLPEDCANNIVEVDTSEMLLNADSNASAVASTEEAPSVSKIIKFAIPAIGVWLCGPILSLIDTSAVGLLSGTAQQAALNPAVAISDYTNLLLAFLFTATTNLSASAQAADKGDTDSPQTTKTLITALQLSGYVGTAVGAALILGSKFLVKTMVGNDAIDPEVITAAMNYVRIRALGVPAAAIIGSAQSACLGMKDIRSPLYVLLAAAVVNFFGDVLFVGSSNPFIGGAAGAAWATTFSQYAALGMFLKWLRSKKDDKVQHDNVESSANFTINISDAIMELTGSHGSKGSGRRAKFRQALKSLRMSSSSDDAGSEDKAAKKADDDTFSTRGFLKNKMRKRDIFKFPSRESAKEFLPYVLPVTTTSIGRVSSYAAMAHVVASSLGTVAMAAQQIVLSLFYCLTPIADSLGLTAQSFVPGIHSQKDSPNRPDSIRQTTTNFYKAGAIFSAAMVGAVATIPIFSKFFTSDPTVVGMVNSVAPFLAVFFASHGMFSASEGVLLGQKDLGFLGKSYATFFAVVPALMLQVKRAALSGTRVVDLTSVWGVFVSYQLFRSVMWGLRLLQLQRRVNSEATLQA